MLSVVALVCMAASAALAQSGKGSQQQQRSQNSYASQAVQSPGTQVRQRVQSSGPLQTTTPASSGKTRRQPQQPIIQQQREVSPVNQYRQQQIEQQREEQQQVGSGGSTPSKQLPFQQQREQVATSATTTTEDPLADSEPALYGSVAGAPGVDFPAYTRIPKTSFTCEGKGLDFGFYADEEAQCQVYHVCWSGRRESFLCGVGTVFNQAILACDYWHSVDCSKTAQFYGVNSELGKLLPFELLLVWWSSSRLARCQRGFRLRKC